MSKERKALNPNELSALPKGTIPKCPCCEADEVTVSMSNARPTKVWCNSCGYCEHLKDEKKEALPVEIHDEKKADKKAH